MKAVCRECWEKFVKTCLYLFVNHGVNVLTCVEMIREFNGYSGCKNCIKDGK